MRNNNFIERREKTEGGEIITQIDVEVARRMELSPFWFLPRILAPRLDYRIQQYAITATAGQTPQYLPLEINPWMINPQTSTLWKLKQFWRCKR